jgi:hypothetical protein
MRSWIGHGLFAAVLAGSLVAKERAPDTPNDAATFESAIVRVARAHTLALREKVDGEAEMEALVFEAPGCSGPVFVVPRVGTFEEESIVPSVSDGRYLRQYIYVERKWDKPDRLGVLAERIKHGALAMFGLTPYALSWTVLQVDAPKDCAITNALDWRLVWDRNTLVAADSEIRSQQEVKAGGQE